MHPFFVHLTHFPSYAIKIESFLEKLIPSFETTTEKPLKGRIFPIDCRRCEGNSTITSDTVSKRVVHGIVVAVLLINQAPPLPIYGY